jgi:hypothetical protein
MCAVCSNVYKMNCRVAYGKDMRLDIAVVCSSAHVNVVAVLLHACSKSSCLTNLCAQRSSILLCTLHNTDVANMLQQVPQLLDMDYRSVNQTLMIHISLLIYYSYTCIMSVYTAIDYALCSVKVNTVVLYNNTVQHIIMHLYP